ncbi:MAG: GNAT family N-acetyltransferase [Crocinitomix sp.]|nr:GNAT family N-acetyltransferase [Crocinitomix sp.]
MTTEIKHFSELTQDEFHDTIALRISVFVVEQDCPYQELDGLDKDAYHVLIKEEGKVIGTTRILKPGVAYAETAIGRVVSATDKRHLKLGHTLMEASMRFVKDEMKEQAVRLSAQSHLKGYYARYGFVPTGKDYLEDGIPHSEMLFST